MEMCCLEFFFSVFSCTRIVLVGSDRIEFVRSELSDLFEISLKSLKQISAAELLSGSALRSLNPLFENVR